MKRLLSAVALLTLTTPSLAQSPACDRLYYLRNEFYNAKGLCFTRREAIRRFPENPSTCQYESTDDLPMSPKDHQRMQMVRYREIQLRCFRH